MNITRRNSVIFILAFGSDFSGCRIIVYTILPSQLPEAADIIFKLNMLAQELPLDK